MQMQPIPSRNRPASDTLLAQCLRVIQRHPVKSLAGWAPRLEVLDSGRLQALYSGRELRSRILRAIALGHGWHDETTPQQLLLAASSVCLSNSTKLTLAGIARVLELAGPALEALDLTNQFVVTDDLVAGLTLTCPGLRVVSLVGCRKISGAIVDSLFRLSRLAHIDLGGCFNITSADALRLVQGHSNAAQFTGLGLAGLAEPAVLEVVSKRTGGLSWLSVGYSAADAPALLSLVEANPLLASLCLHWCEGADDALLTGLASACPRLYHIDVTGCKGITNTGIIGLVAALGRCDADAGRAASHVDVVSPGARRWDLDDTEWLDFALHCSRLTDVKASKSVDDVEMVAAERGPLRVILAKHSGVTRGVGEPLNRMGAVLQLLV